MMNRNICDVEPVLAVPMILILQWLLLETAHAVMLNVKDLVLLFDPAHAVARMLLFFQPLSNGPTTFLPGNRMIAPTRSLRC